MQLSGKIVLITGAKGGLGSHVTNAFLSAGAQVAGVSRSIKDADFSSPSFRAFAAELSTAENARQLVASVVERHGRIDAMIHLMGGYAGGQSVVDTGDDTFEHLLDLNLRSLFHMVRAVLPPMRANGSGRILAIGSRAAVEPLAMAGAYSASKAAMVALMSAVAKENQGTGIAANVILPGAIDTAANRAAMPGADPSKWVRPEQIADLLVYLVNDQSSQLSGAVIPFYGADL
ncbi:SDR family NAD(P)-dependent oxidoreductase [uncultured Paludibaculum sp.]|uniref:SDR family NAD(P)-dependent oxidoreductase n=1 Tax=uncultured Paludibaculum sp. TaxID=1765020 RepID=UPI002AABB26F|nr:SDR family NAD(P)-dependent oxidoreductase [uncultured Paludibaculum sp.]